MDDLNEELKAKIAARVRDELSCQDYVSIGGTSMHHPPVTIELLDKGMIVHYQIPVKRMKPPPVRSQDPFTQVLIAMMPKIIENIMGEEEGEDWSEEKRAKKEMIKAAMEKGQEMLNPKPKEEWIWTSQRMVVSGDKELSEAINVARQAYAVAKTIQESGEYIRHAGMGIYPQDVARYTFGDGIGSYVQNAPSVTPSPGPSVDAGDLL